MRSMKLHPERMIDQQENRKLSVELHSSSHFKTLLRLVNDKHHPSEPVDVQFIFKRAVSQKCQHTIVCELYQRYATSLWATLKSTPITWIRTVVAGCWSSWEHIYSLPVIRPHSVFTPCALIITGHSPYSVHFQEM